MQAVLAKFPDAVVEEWAPVMFLPLVTRLVNDPVANVRAAVGQTLRALLQVPPPLPPLPHTYLHSVCDA